MSLERIKVIQNIDSNLDFEMTVLELKRQCEEWLRDYGETAFIEAEYWGYDGGIDWKLNIKRDETDEEYSFRCEKHKQQIKKVKQRELKELERLKKKYEH